MPSKITYGIKAIIPVEVGVTNLRKDFFFQEKCNDDELKMNLDCLDEARDEASQRMEKYQQKMASYYNQSRLQVDSVNIKSPKGGRTTKVAYGRTV